MKRFSILSLLLVALLRITAAYAQNVVTPYSMYGYGILGDNATAAQRQMGGTGIASRSGRQINVMNPASYAAIDTLTFLFDIGADVSILWSKEGSKNQRQTGGGLDYLTMQFPLGKYMGGSVGLLPYTSVGYAFGNAIEHGAMQNQGSGGINQAYVGVSGRFAGFSAGANVSYNFGNIINDVYSTPSSASQSLFEHVMQVRDWNILLGAQYGFRPDKFSYLTLGFTYQPKKSMRGKTWCTRQVVGLDNLPDTLAYSRLNGKYYQPNAYGAGISYRHTRTSQFMVEADFIYQQWSKAPYSPLFNDDDQIVFDGMKFNDRWRVGLGGEWMPKLRGNFLQRVTYRLGAYYSRDYIIVRDNNMKEYGITAGFGIPTPEGKTMINVGFEWKHRNTSPVSMIRENYFNITLGLNFNEMWFWQRKIK